MSEKPMRKEDAPTPSSERDDTDDRQVSNKDLSTNELSYLHLEAMEELVSVMKDLRNMLANDELTDLREASENGETPTTRDGKPVKDKYVLDAEEAAEKLTEAANSDHINVTANDGLVWVQTAKDSPGWAFEQYLKSVDAVTYVHEDHEDYDRKPGEWWKNAIVPSDVDDYIDEVV